MKYTIYILLILFLIPSCSGRNNPPEAEKGILDLRSWNFQDKNKVKLSGQWNIYWNQLISGSEKKDRKDPKDNGFFYLPQRWYNKDLDDGTHIDSKGYATFHLKILMPESFIKSNKNMVTLYLQYAVSAYKIYLKTDEGAKLLCKGGILGTTKDTTVPLFVPGKSTFRATPEINLFFQVANFHEGYNNGPYSALYLGTPRQITKTIIIRRSVDFFLAGVIFFVAVYQLLLYILKRTESVSLGFGVFCILVVIRIVLKGRYIEELLPSTYLWGLYYKAEYITFYLGMAMFATYFYSIFSETASKVIARIIQGLSIAGTVAVVFLPAMYYTKSLPYYQILAILGIIWVIYETIKAGLLEKDIIPWIILGGIGIFMTTVINDILHVQNIIYSTHLFHYGLFVLIFANAAAIAIRNTRARNKAERFSNKLNDINIDLLNEMEERKKAEDKVLLQYEEIESQYHELEAMNHEIEIANRELNAIQEELFNTNLSLGEEKELLSTTLRSITDGVITIDLEGKILIFNNIAEKLTGWESEKANGKNIASVVHLVDENTGSDIANPIFQVLKTGEGIELNRGTQIIAQNETRRFIAGTAAPIRDTKSNTIGGVLVFRDISEWLKTEEELLKSSKIESLGVFAGGIAHDFNNILTAITGNISLVLSNIHIEDNNYPNLKAAERASLRARDLTAQLLTFSKGGSPIKRITSINDILKETVEFVLSGSRVKVHFLIANDLKNVEVDQGQISQVIHNIVLNARQAMPYGGNVTIKAENKFIAKDEIMPLSKGEYCRITIEDEGSGIPYELLPNIFDPYFTTKSSGTGLGLTITYSIIKKHDGHIHVESEKGRGSTFTIYIPSTNAMVFENKEEKGSGVKKGGRILLMDDDEMVIEVAGKMLTKMGYTVISSPDGDDAVIKYKEAMNSGNAFDCIIMDLTIPGGMGGKEALMVLKEYDPDIKAIVSSGYSNDPVMANFRDYGFKSCVVKPYRYEDLKETISSVMIALTD